MSVNFVKFYLNAVLKMVRRSERCFRSRSRKIRSNKHDQIIIGDEEVYLVLIVVRVTILMFHMYIICSIGTYIIFTLYSCIS